MTSAGGDGHDLGFFASPAADGRKYKRVFKKVTAFEIREHPFVEDVAGNEGAVCRVFLVGFLFHGADNHARGEEFGI